MINIYPVGMLQGECFSPVEFEKKTGVFLSKKNEPGEIGKSGRFKGKPIPYGSGHIELFDVKEGLSGNLTFDNLLVQTLIQYHDVLRSCGATDIYIYLAVGYLDQCNLAFDAKLMQALGERDIELWVSCYSQDDDEKDYPEIKWD